MIKRKTLESDWEAASEKAKANLRKHAMVILKQDPLSIINFSAPRFTIEQMIEYLGDQSDYYWSMEIGNTPMVVQSSELCDKLWEEVKQIAEKTN